MIDPKDIQTFTAHGSGNMGDVTDPDSTCRFRLTHNREGEPVERWCLAWVRLGFLSGTSQNDLAIKVDHRKVLTGAAYEYPSSTVKTTPFDFTLFTIEDAGVDGWRGLMRIPDDELRDYVFQNTDEGQDVCVLEWTNPNTQEWGVEVGLIDAAKIPGTGACMIRLS